MNRINIIFSKHISNCNQLTKSINKRFSGTVSDETAKQNHLFDTEQKRQKESIGRIEKIEVQYEGVPENAVYIMNKNLSTPFDCAKHLGEKFADRSAVALLNSTTLWHMHKPLPDACKIELLHYNMPQPAAVNKIFWRSCSFLLGAVANNAFKDKINVLLHSFPSPNVRSGSFVYDIQLSLDDWQPTESELKVLSIEMIKFCQKNYPIETLDVSVDLASEIFQQNTHKYHQIPDIAAHNNGKITLFRAGHHIDISKGPMVANTNHLGRITVANIIKLDTDISGGPIYRFQGVALPKSMILNHFAYSLLEDRAKTLNPARIPSTQENVNEDHSFVAQISV